MKYERLTMKTINGYGISGELVDQKQPAFDIMIDSSDIVINRLAELEDKIENGTLVELPCKVGDTVYVLCKGDYVLVGEKTGWKYTIKKLKFTLSTFSTWEYGRTLFLTKAEAEQKIKELHND